MGYTDPTNDLFGYVQENKAFLNEQIITYLGNKRALLTFIGTALDLVTKRLGKEKLVMFDAFAGSGIVSRFFKKYASMLYTNDLESYTECINKCYLSNKSQINMGQLLDVVEKTKAKVEQNLHPGFISELYAPANQENIQPGERVFFTKRNANYIDTARQEIEKVPAELKCYLLAPLLYGASVHNNTSGVFKGFYKNKEGIGQYGGTGQNALKRILGEIELQMPVFSNFECEYSILRKDALEASKTLPEEVDIAYLDPPYNQHPYGSNYFMLNLIHSYQRPEEVSSVSGIPCSWNHSLYNQKKFAQNELFSLVASLQAKYVLISYNSDGFVKFDDFINYLSSLGEVQVMTTDYNTFRGCRNLNSRDIHVKEFLFLVEKK